MASTTNILILGGSGRVGKQIITDALSHGHKVTALVRNPDSITPQPNLTLVTGSPISAPDILKALHTIPECADSSSPQTQVTIISTLGQTRTNPSNPWSTPTSPPLYMSQSALAVVDALHQATTTTIPITVRKFIVLSAFGTGDSWSHLHWSLKWVMAHSNMAQMLEDHNAVIKVVEANFGAKDSRQDVADTATTTTGKLSIPYLVVRPVMLKFGQTGPVPEVKVYGHGRAGMGMMLGCDVRSVSAFMLDQVAGTELDGTMPVISN